MKNEKESGVEGLGLDIVFSGILLLFSVYCFILVGVESPAPTPTELGAAFWPRIVLALMVLLLIINMVKEIKNKDANMQKLNKESITEFFKSKLFLGMLIVAVMAFLMEPLGFTLTTFLFLAAYCILLGERRPHIIVLMGIVITILLYVVFQGALDIMLPRGIGFLREFALWLETILPI